MLGLKAAKSESIENRMALFHFSNTHGPFSYFFPKLEFLKAALDLLLMPPF
jgi:hypothetical protein